MRRAALGLTALLVTAVALPAYPCVESKRSSGEAVYYPSIYVDRSGFPSQFHADLSAASGEWNGCNYNQKSDFPLLQYVDPGTRTVRFFFQSGFSSSNRSACGVFDGINVTVFEFAENEFGERIPCTRSDVLQDVLAHEFGHVYSLNDSKCDNNIMGSLSWRNNSFTGTKVQDEECEKVDDVYYTEEEERQELCAEDDTLSICETAPECEVRGTQGCSPIIVDFEGDGFDLTGFDSPVNFDINADGYLETTGWTRGGERFDDAFLALDRNGNGEIDSGAELFGDSTPLNGGTAPHGYEALYALDQGGNANGWIDSGDAVYRHLVLWFDENHNGVSERNELRPLAALGVLAIEVEPYALGKEHDEHGNYARYLGRAIVRRDGGHVVVLTADVFFVVAP